MKDKSTIDLQWRHGFAVVIFCLVLIVAAGVLFSQAANPHVKLEAESGTRSGAVSVISDSGASNSQALQYWAQPTGPSGKKCVVFLHGKGGSGQATTQQGDQTWIWPNGNADGWGGRQWLYATTTEYNQALTNITNSVNPQNCGQIVLAGGSNGAAMAAKMYCQGYNFGGKLVGVIPDDPVPDQGVDNCAPAQDVELQLVQSDEMNSWVGSSIRTCASMGDWTCQGNVLPRAIYASRIGAANPYYSPSHSGVQHLYNGWMNEWWN